MSDTQTSILELVQVSKTFRGRVGAVAALRGVSLRVDAGELVVIRGPSGCGKTTVLLTAGALLRPDQGTVRLCGQDPYALAPEARSVLRAQGVGFVFQQFHLLPYLSVLDNILVASVACPEADAGARALDLARGFGLDPRLAHVPAELSIGERQRTALARALLNRPRLLLADEPTGNLDEANGAQVLAHLAEFAKAGGAVVIVTHDAAVTKYATRVLTMAAGALVPTGAARDTPARGQ